MGHYYQPQNGDKLQGISLLDAYTQAGNKRFIGNVTVQTEFVDPNTLVGFENHSGLTYLQGSTEPLGKILTGNGNNGVDGTEGARFKNELALGSKPEPLDDKIENLTHNSLVGKKY